MRFFRAALAAIFVSISVSGSAAAFGQVVGDSLRLYSIPTSEEVRMATAAALDEGYRVDDAGTFLNELHGPDGKPPHPGYITIGLYSDGNLVHSYSIRIETGDIADAETCTLFAYPDLLEFRRKIMTQFGTDPATPAKMAEELGCARLDTVRVPRRAKR